MLPCELNGINIDEHTIGLLAEHLFHPVQLNDKDYYTPLSEIDPYKIFFNKNINSHLGHTFYYYLENSFYDLLKQIVKQIAFQQIMYFPCVT